MIAMGLYTVDDTGVCIRAAILEWLHAAGLPCNLFWFLGACDPIGS